MPTHPRTPFLPVPALFALAALALAGQAWSTRAWAKQPADLAGTWDLAFDKTGATCRILLRADRSDQGDYFLGMPSACRHAMPGIAAIGRWGVPDEGHLSLDEPGGRALLTLEAAGEGFVQSGPVGTYTLKPVRGARADAKDVARDPARDPARNADGSATGSPAAMATQLTPVATLAATPTDAPPARKAKAEAPDTAADLAGRYAVMRDKRDTGCMVTLDKSHIKGGDRAQLAPGCRDQGIVVFDPSAWQIIRGELVLIARAGHKTKLEKGEDGVWAKDPKEGGKPLGLKKL